MNENANGRYLYPELGKAPRSVSGAISSSRGKLGTEPGSGPERTRLKTRVWGAARPARGEI